VNAETSNACAREYNIDHERADSLTPEEVGYLMCEENDWKESRPTPATDHLTARSDPVLAELWDNDEDAVYDDIELEWGDTHG